MSRRCRAVAAAMAAVERPPGASGHRGSLEGQCGHWRGQCGHGLRLCGGSFVQCVYSCVCAKKTISKCVTGLLKYCAAINPRPMSERDIGELRSSKNGAKTRVSGSNRTGGQLDRSHSTVCGTCAQGNQRV